MNSLFPHVALHLDKQSFAFVTEEWPNDDVKNFFEQLPEKLLESDMFEIAELATAESSELIIAAFQAAANEAVEDGEISEEVYLTIVETTTVISVVYVNNLSAGVVFVDFSGEASDDDDTSDWE